MKKAVEVQSNVIEALNLRVAQIEEAMRVDERKKLRSDQRDF